MVFAVHGTICTVVVIIQSYKYERGDQRVSTPVRIAIYLLALTTLLCAGLIHSNFIQWQWLDFVYFASYVKLIVTLKYTPQVRYTINKRCNKGLQIMCICFCFQGIHELQKEKHRGLQHWGRSSGFEWRALKRRTDGRECS